MVSLFPGTGSRFILLHCILFYFKFCFILESLEMKLFVYIFVSTMRQAYLSYPIVVTLSFNILTVILIHFVSNYCWVSTLHQTLDGVREGGWRTGSSDALLPALKPSGGHRYDEGGESHDSLWAAPHESLSVTEGLRLCLSWVVHAGKLPERVSVVTPDYTRKDEP